VPTLQQQFREAHRRSGLTLLQLLERSGLPITLGSLSRKLRGKQMLRSEECEALAKALDFTASVGQGAARARRRAS